MLARQHPHTCTCNLQNFSENHRIMSLPITTGILGSIIGRIRIVVLLEILIRKVREFVVVKKDDKTNY